MVQVANAITPTNVAPEKCLTQSRLESGNFCELSVKVPGVSCSTTSLVPSCYVAPRVREHSTHPSSLPIEWAGLPRGTKSFAVFVENSGTFDRPVRNGHVVWFVADISPSTTQILANASSTNDMPGLSVEYPNSFSTTSYLPPCSDPTIAATDDSRRRLRVTVLAIAHERVQLFGWPKILDSNVPFPTSEELVKGLGKSVLCWASVDVWYTCGDQVPELHHQLVQEAAQEAAIPGEI
eukprot:c28738_g1_i1.p1 GENE.c28738_g1_i1~~c28738_g1_i1.p1  ORF type:complete len:237 (-),score=47.76 c28738_g1_i1:18-728(-)